MAVISSYLLNPCLLYTYGARVITYTICASESEGRVYLVDVYDKSDFSTAVSYTHLDVYKRQQQSEDNAPKALSNTRYTMTFPIYGRHSSAVASSQTTMILSYDGPKPSSVTIQSLSLIHI